MLNASYHCEASDDPVRVLGDKFNLVVIAQRDINKSVESSVNSLHEIVKLQTAKFLELQSRLNALTTLVNAQNLVIKRVEGEAGSCHS